MSLLSRPKWRVGQVLRPKHLRALEESLSAEAARRAHCDGLPPHGFARLEWNGEDPGVEVVSVHGLSAVFPGGAVVDVPDNADVPLSLSLVDLGGLVIDVFVQLVDDPVDDDDIDPLRAPDGEEIARERLRLRLSASAEGKRSRDQLFLARFVRKNGKLGLDPETIPPLLRIDAWRPLVGKLNEVRVGLGRLDRKLDALAIEAVNQGQSRAPIHRARLESRKLFALLDDMKGEGDRRPIAVHPYGVFSALRAFAGELSVLAEAVPNALPAYDHDRPGVGFSKVFGDIAEGVDRAPPGLPRVPFVADEEGRFVAVLPDAARAASEVFVVVLMASAEDKVPFDRVKLASRERLRSVREYALSGVKQKHEKDVAVRARYGFGAGADLYSLTTTKAEAEGDLLEWDYVVRSRTLAFQSTPELSRHRFVLCWSAT